MHKSSQNHNDLISNQAIIGKRTKIWFGTQVREKAKIGNDCIIGKDVYIDFGVCIGNNVKIQNGCFIYHGTKIENGVFLGPGVILTNDRVPRAILPSGKLKNNSDWKVEEIYIKKGASLGAGVIVLPGICIEEFAMVGAGSVVTKNVPKYGLVVGNPARLIGNVCECGQKIIKNRCKLCKKSFPL